ncbi:MAG: alpha/beta hydrolase [Lewinellaceae bacterium]|nr:alpha/beta hydrolase [Lewinellaceae bacterium]
MKVFIYITFLLGFIHCNAQPRIQTREEAVALLHDLRKIHTPKGIDTLEQIELNGEKQWINIRGKNKSNPILLFIHGGPASPMMPVAWAFQNGWEDYFTVVQWDQRVSGKNWTTTDTTKAVANLNRKMIVQDGIALVQYLCEKLNQQKVFILGYSFGSRVGIELISLIPEKVFAYVGVGQMSGGDQEAFIYNRLLTLAAESNNELALQELKTIAPYPNTDGANPIRKLLLVRKWARYFNGGWYGKPNLDLFFSLPELSPEYSEQDITRIDSGNAWAARKILQQSEGNAFPDTFRTPILFLMGRHDLHTPHDLALAYFNKLSAPNKKFITFEHSGHFPMLEEPGRFLVTLVNEVLPLAKE